MKYNLKKICLITPSLERGGFERVLTLIANHADDIGIKVKIICLIKNKIEYTLNDNIIIDSPKKPYKGGLIEKIRIIKYLIKTLRKESPDTILSFSEVFNPLSIISAKLAGCKIFISDRSSPEKKLSIQTRFLQKILYPLSDGIIAQTEQSKKKAKSKKYNRNIKVIANPLRSIDDSIKKKYNNIVISMGKLIPSKNFSDLIDIFIEADPNKKWQLIILGDGPERKNLEKKIKDLKEENRIKLVGSVKNVDYYFSLSSIFSFTSLSEGFPNALSEAIAFPLASIAYNCSAGPADIIKDGENGYLIPLLNKDIYVEKLSKLMESVNLNKKMISNYQEYRNKYSKNKICQEYIDYILAPSLKNNFNK
ncbi:MAG: glycosyltransferase family 4 protein [Candidatus Moranbacteria bacterium]|nr:glycosyltransferase family 4 protein [Candidatus Moranbacteria bacterium]